MKITICSLLLLAGTAFADNKLQLSRVGPAEPAPELSTSCTAQKAHTRWTSTKLEARVVEVLHECGDDAHTQLAFEAKDAAKGVHLYTSAIVGTNQWPTEQVTIGKLKGGKKALLHRVDVRHDDRTDSRIDVCTFDTDGAPKCGFAEVTCPETGCKEPEIIKGALWIHTKDGRRRYVIE